MKIHGIPNARKWFRPQVCVPSNKNKSFKQIMLMKPCFTSRYTLVILIVILYNYYIFIFIGCMYTVNQVIIFWKTFIYSEIYSVFPSLVHSRNINEPLSMCHSLCRTEERSPHGAQGMMGKIYSNNYTKKIYNSNIIDTTKERQQSTR